MISLKKLLGSAEVRNIFWMVADRIWRMVIGLLVGAWVVRYLGPDNYGQINYVLAFIGIATVVVNMGMESFLIKELVTDPESKTKIIHAAFQLRLAMAVTMFCLLLIWVLAAGEPLQVLWLFFILVPQLLTTSFTVADLFFQAELKSRITIVCRNVFFVLGALLKVIAILTHQNIYVFAALTIFDLILADIFLFFYYRQKFGKTSPVKIDMSYLKALWKKSIPFLLSNVAIVLYMKIDQILLGKLASVKEVGFFTAATKVAEIFYFIPLVITGSLYGLLINSKKDSVKKFTSTARILFFSLAGLALLISVLISVITEPIVMLLYGSKFLDSANILQVYIWATVAIFGGVAFNQLLVIENLSHAILYKTLIGVLLNIILNVVLIPGYGAMGAAIATIITQFISSIVANFFFPKTRSVFLGYFSGTR